MFRIFEFLRRLFPESNQPMLHTRQFTRYTQTMATAIFGGKIGYQGHHRNPIEIGATPGVVKHQGLSRISTVFRLNPTKLLTIARKNRVSMELDANIEKRQPTKALASQKRFHCLHQVRISGGRHFKHIKWRNDWDRLHRPAFRK